MTSPVASPPPASPSPPSSSFPSVHQSGFRSRADSNADELLKRLEGKCLNIIKFKIKIYVLRIFGELLDLKRASKGSFMSRFEPKSVRFWLIDFFLI